LPGTLQDYIALDPAGCNVGSTLFSEFVLAPPAGFVTPIDPAAIGVVPTTGPFSSGFDLVLDSSAGLGEVFGVLFGFFVSGPSLTGASAALNGSSATGDGAVTVVENVCIGGFFLPFEPSGCDGIPDSLIAFDIGLDELTSAKLLFPPANFLHVFKDVTIDGGLLGSGALAGVSNQFHAVPEPASFGLLVSGFCGLWLLRRRSYLQNGFRGGRVHKPNAGWLLVLMLSLLATGFAANHREAPITAFDHKADITDVYAFRSYGGGTTPRVTMILCVDPLLEPANGPNWFPFDPDILYAIKIDNNNDAVADIVFQFRFQTEQRLPNLFQAYAGVNSGAVAPSNSPLPVPPGTLIVPPRIATFGDVGLGQRQSYRVTMVKNGISTPLTGGTPLYVVPANAGPRTMDYNALFNSGIYSLGSNMKVFAGTTDDAFWIDLGGAFDTLNTHIFPVLSAAQDAALQNFASDTVSGYAVNSIAIEVPVSMLTRTGAVEPSTSTAATIGIWATTSRPRLTVRRAPLPGESSGTFSQVQRMGNPLINELLIGTGFKDRFSMDLPKNDAQFASFFLDPALARVVNALTAGTVAIKTPPRLDLLPVVTYAPPIAATGTPAGPIADLLRLNTGVAPTLPGSPTLSRLGLLGGDPAGFPNGRRVFDDVTDVALRLVVGGVLGAPFPGFNANIGGKLGDGVNVNDATYRNDFPYLADAPSGRDRRHVDPGEPGCLGAPGGVCP
jgi:hypothetical protein